MATNQFTVTWQKQKFQVAFDFANTSLAILKDYLFHLTGVPVDSMKLMHSGAIMKDPQAMLAQYGIKNNSQVLMMGRAPEPVLSTEQIESEKIPKAIEASLEFLPKLAEFEAMLLAMRPNHRDRLQAVMKTFPDLLAHEILVHYHEKHGSERPKLDQELTEQHLQYTYRLISESFLRILLKLDEVKCPPECPDIRQHRKDAVVQIQRILDYADKLWQLSKEQ